MLSNAFNTLLKLHRKSAKVTRLDRGTAKSPKNEKVEYNTYVTPANYSRKLEGPESTTFKGREFIVSKSELPIVPKRGDILSVDSEEWAINEVNEIYDLGAKVIGYRLSVDK